MISLRQLRENNPVGHTITFTETKATKPKVDAFTGAAESDKATVRRILDNERSRAARRKKSKK